VPTQMLTEKGHRAAPPWPAPTEPRRKARSQAERVHRLKLVVTGWVLAATLVTVLWVVDERQANGPLERFGHEGEPGQWNPTLWAVAVGLSGLVVGILALHTYLERPPTATEVDDEAERMRHCPTGSRRPADELAGIAGKRLERIRRVRFDVAVWALGMLVLTPLWALIEWQDNGGFERWSNDSQPGDWEPWILYVGGFWLLAVAVRTLRASFARSPTASEIDRELRRLPRGG
jgi:hypothetical protein